MAAESASRRRYQASGRVRNFTAIPNPVLRRTDLSGNAKALFAIILDIVEYKREEPDLEGLGALLGGGEKTARSAVRELEAVGLLEVLRRGRGLPNGYFLNDPETANLERPLGPIKKRPEGRSRNALRAEPSRARVPSSEVKTAVEPTVPPRSAHVDGRNLPVDALAQACGVDMRNRAKASELTKALKDIRQYAWDDLPPETRAGLDELGDPSAFDRHLAVVIGDRGRAYQQHPKLRDAMLTPSALAKWWHDLDPRRVSSNGRQINERFASIDKLG